MPNYSKASNEKLNSCHPDLQKVMNEVIKYFDNTILYGHRIPDLQFQLFKQGRKFEDGKWVVVNRKEVVTDKDGFMNSSTHNFDPSKAVDAVPYPIDWNDLNRIRYFAGFVVGMAELMYSRGDISHRIRWGGDWDKDTDLNDQTFNDLVHFEIY